MPYGNSFYNTGSQPTEQQFGNIVGLSEKEDELEELKRQRLMAEQLLGGSMEAPPTKARGVGGALNVLSALGKGYMGGKMLGKNMEDRKLGRESRIRTRGDLYKMIYGDKQDPNLSAYIDTQGGMAPLTAAEIDPTLLY